MVAFNNFSVLLREGLELEILSLVKEMKKRGIKSPDW